MIPKGPVVSFVARVAVALTAGILLVACGSGGGHAGHDAEASVHDPVEGAPATTVTAVDIDFEPATLALQAGEATNVTVVNEGGTLHDFTLEEADVHANVEPGEEVTTAVTVDEPGTYKAICTVEGHAEAGMEVEVTVTE